MACQILSIIGIIALAVAAIPAAGAAVFYLCVWWPEGRDLRGRR